MNPKVFDLKYTAKEKEHFVTARGRAVSIHARHSDVGLNVYERFLVTAVSMDLGQQKFEATVEVWFEKETGEVIESINKKFITCTMTQTEFAHYEQKELPLLSKYLVNLVQAHILKHPRSYALGQPAEPPRPEGIIPNL